MRNIRKTLLMTLCSIFLGACSNSSTDSGIKQGTDTESFAGDYEGTLELELTADTVGYNPHSDSGSVPVQVEITGGGVVRLTIDNYMVEGIIDNDGDWKLEVAINEFSALIDEENKDILKQAGCPLDKPFVKIEGTVTSPDMSGDVSGRRYCTVPITSMGALSIAKLTASKQWVPLVPTLPADQYR